MDKDTKEPVADNSVSTAGKADTGAASAAAKPEAPKQQAGSDTAVDKPQAPRQDTGKNTRPRKRKSKAWVSLLILILLAGAGYYGWRHYGDTIDNALEGVSSGFSRPSSSDTSSENVAQSADEEDADTVGPTTEPVSAPAQGTVETALEEQLSELGQRHREQIEQLQAQMGDLQVQLASQQQRLQALSTTTREDWLLAEAEYLLRLASQRILTERETRNALSLMASADAILKEIDDPGLFGVRRAVAADITGLKVAGVVDREGLYLQVDALIALIPDLEVPLVDQPEEPAVDEVERSWSEKLADNAVQALRKLSGIVRVERTDVPSGPRLLPSEQALLRLNLRLALEQAQQALLREEQAIYTRSLEKAREFLTEHFLDDAEARVLVEEIDALLEQTVVQPLPTVNSSIRALSDYIDLWHDQYPAPGGEPDREGVQ